MNFIQSYLENINKLKELLIVDCVENHPHKKESNIIYVDTTEFDHGGVDVLYYLNNGKVPFCKIEYSDKGVLFYETQKHKFYEKEDTN